ncbi:MAG: T9SS type A sorting domain-containing protein [Candidatus Kapabacteria bacterium]|nr:T9SS type A sorting domain-containing protein [Candidatus Kapabacteria bacterium]
MKKCFIFALTATLWLCASLVFADNYFADTVWTKKLGMNIYSVKFSKNDSLIVGQGSQSDVFLDAKTGKELKYIIGIGNVHFIHNDLNFLRISQDLKKIEIWDTKTFLLVDSLENDGIMLGGINYTFDVSSDERFIVCVIPYGFRTWDITTKKIIKTYLFPSQPTLKSLDMEYIRFTCDNSKFIGQLKRVYPDTKPPFSDLTYRWDVMYDFNTLDSIDVLGSYYNVQLSHNCKYFVDNFADSFNGVEVRDFNTKQLLSTLPINGYTLTGMEFSPDDKYLVTSAGMGSDYGLKIFDLETKKNVYTNKDGGFSNFTISHNGNFIITSIENVLLLYPSKFLHSWSKDSINQNIHVVSPNPTNGEITISFNTYFLIPTLINITDLNGALVQNIFNGLFPIGQNTFQFNASDITNGAYLISIQNGKETQSFKLIINK